MIARNSLTTDTPETLIVGIAHKAGRTAITAALRLINGDIESDIVEMVNGDVWQTLVIALDDLRIVRAKHIVMMTSCSEVYDFFQKPIYVKQVETKQVWVGREVFNVKVGGNEYQWQILRYLFPYVWRCERVNSLRKTEGLL